MKDFVAVSALFLPDHILAHTALFPAYIKGMQITQTLLSYPTLRYLKTSVISLRHHGSRVSSKRASQTLAVLH